MPRDLKGTDMFKSDVFERYGADAMSRRTFYFVLGAILAWGFGLTAALSELTAGWNPNIWVFLGVALVLPIIGIVMSAKSDNPLVSFIGFNLVVVPFGVILGPALAAYKVASPGVVAEAAMLTAIVTGVMGLSGVLFPKFYEGLGGALFGALLCLVVVRVIGLFVPAIGNLGIIDYVAAAIFALYIGYDMYRASTIPATLDNAVDVAVALYLDIINLFLNILRILGGRK